MHHAPTGSAADEIPVNHKCQTAWTDRKPIICSCGDHAFVAATRGYTTMVSPEDVLLLGVKWYADPTKRVVRIRAPFGVRPNRKQKLLHRVVLRAKDGQQVDHINGDETDNRRGNLRLCTAAQNAWNRRKEKTSKNPYKGVSATSGGRFQASIMANGRGFYLGTFESADEAHAAYCAAAKRLHGEFARAG